MEERKTEIDLGHTNLMEQVISSIIDVGAFCKFNVSINEKKTYLML